jgi:predicted Zn-dependent peptidase
LLVVPVPNAHRTVLAAHLLIGSRFEDASNNGISHFLEHMLYRGTEDHPSAHDLAVAFERLGGSLVATTSSEMGTLEVSIPPVSFDAVLPLFRDAYAAPAFSAIDVERGIVREEILESLDERGDCISPDDLIRRLLFQEHPLGQPISGTLAQLASFTVEGLRGHHERFYTGCNTVFAVVGPVDVNRTLAQLESAFSPLAAGTPPTVQPPAALVGPCLQRVSHRASQTEVTLGFRAPGARAADEPSMDLLSRILDDGMATRLYHRLCDENGLCYDVSGGYESYSDSGLLELTAETGHERVAQVVKELLNIVSDLRERGPSEEELRSAQQRYRWQLESMLDSPPSIAEFFLSEELSGSARSPLEREADLLRVSVRDVQAAANQWLTRSNLGLVLVGVPKKSELSRVSELIDRFS